MGFKVKYERQCIMCAARRGEALDIRDGVWQFAPCPSCHQRDVLWPVLPPQGLMENDAQTPDQNEPKPKAAA
jgi:hypothetical protein